MSRGEILAGLPTGAGGVDRVSELRMPSHRAFAVARQLLAKRTQQPASDRRLGGLERDQRGRGLRERLAGEQQARALGTAFARSSDFQMRGRQ